MRAFDWQMTLYAARCQHQLRIIECLAGFQMQLALGAVDLGDALAEQKLDVLLGIEIRPAQQNAIFRRGTLEIGFG